MTQNPAPVQPNERIITLDILRAFALLGILVMNMPGFFTTFWSAEMPHTRWPAWYDRTALAAMEVFFAGKFNSLFAFLFGIGFTIQLERLYARSDRPVAIYMRRIGILLLFGIMHAVFLWTGDVLHMYALLGMFLALLRKAPDKVLAGLVVAGLLLPTVISVYRLFTYGEQKEREDRAMVARMQDMTTKAYGSGTWLEATTVRALEMKEIYSDPRSLSFYPSLFLTILLGYYAGRKKYIQNAADHLRLLRRVRLWSFLVGLACAITFAALLPLLQPFKPSALGVVVSTAFSWQRPALMLFYASTLTVLACTPRWGRQLAVLAPAGRMPLTNYLMQSLICTTIFYGYGFGLYNKIGPAAGLGLAFVIFPLQVAFSNLYFRRFRFGPMEYLWRLLTYGQVRATAPADFPKVSEQAAT